METFQGRFHAMDGIKMCDISHIIKLTSTDG